MQSNMLAPGICLFKYCGPSMVSVQSEAILVQYEHYFALRVLYTKDITVVYSGATIMSKAHEITQWLNAMQF